MMAAMSPVLMMAGAFVAVVIGLKVFFTLWKLFEKRLHPEQFSKPSNMPEIAFRGLKGKPVSVQMKSGEIIGDCQYKATLFFGDGEYNVCPTVYFDFEKPDGNHVYICGTDILKIETVGKI